MPSAYQGTATVPSTTAWAATTGYTTGQNVQPNPATGQYFQCTQSGTSGGTQPAWSTPSALPVPGTTFVDGSVIWTCMGSIITPNEITVDIPLDTDPATTAIIARALKNLANYYKGEIVGKYALLAGNNTFTGTNTFNNLVTLNATELAMEGGSVIEFDAPYGGDSGTSVPILFTENPTSFQRLRLLQAKVAAAIQAWLFADANPDSVGHGGLTFSVNSNWNGSDWTQPNISFASMWAILTETSFDLNWLVAGGDPSTSIQNILTIQPAAGGAFFSQIWQEFDGAPQRDILVSAGPQSPIAPVVTSSYPNITSPSVGAGSSESYGVINFTYSSSAPETGAQTVFSVRNTGTGGSNRQPLGVTIFPLTTGSAQWYPGAGGGSNPTAAISAAAVPTSGGWDFKLDIGSASFAPVADNYSFGYIAYY